MYTGIIMGFPTTLSMNLVRGILGATVLNSLMFL